MSKKTLVAIGLTLFLIAAGGGIAWYMVTPHTPEEQFAYAEKLEKQLRGEALTRGPRELVPQIEKVAEEYRKVETRFGVNPKAAEAHKRIAKMLEEVAKDDTRAIKAFEELIKSYPGEDDAGFGRLEQARLIRKAADALKTGKPLEAADKYKEALKTLDEYRKSFEKGKKVDYAILERGRIYQDGLGDPLIEAIRAFEQIIKDFSQSEHKPEAMYRLGQLYEHAKETEKAMQIYSQLIEEFPKGEFTDKALFARGKILDEKMKEHDKAAKDFERITQEFSDSPLSGQAAGEAKQARQKEAQKEGEEAARGRYGGSVPYDTLRDKPLPPSGMFKQFSEQKLDAQKYDIRIKIDPADQRITVTGTLTLVNRGDDKTKLLLMLSPGLNITKMEVDGTAAPFTHEGETLRLGLPAPIKKDATATISFDYSGQFNEPMAEMPTPATRPATAPATTTAPATQPKKRFAMNLQLALGPDDGFGLSGGAWYPVTVIGDIFDAKMTYTMPPTFEAVANGALLKRAKAEKPGTEGEFIFETKQPVFGLYFAYGQYEVAERKAGKVTYYTYLKPKNAAKSEAYVKVASRILDFYSSKFVEFPYEKMAIIETPLPPFLGGVGPASMMMLHERMVAAKDVPENLLAHELAHQWFGNLVPINMIDPNYNQWLSEGFATYCDALYNEHTSGPAEMAKTMQRYSQLYFTMIMMAPRGKGSIRDTYADSPLYRPVVYEKGAVVLHMLRKQMGDAKFFALMKQFVETYSHKPTTVDDFRRLASTVNGDDLSWFFAQWYDSTVFARWRVAGIKPNSSGPATTVDLLVEQPDEMTRTKFDITLIGPGAARHTIKDQVFDRKEQTFTVTAPFMPEKVILDEEFWVLRHPGSGNIWPEPSPAKP